MTKEQFESAKTIERLINNHIGVKSILNNALATKDSQAKIEFGSTNYFVCGCLMEEFIHPTNRSINRLQKEFDDL